MFYYKLIIVLHFTITNATNGFPFLRFAIKPFCKHNLNTWRFNRNNSAKLSLCLSQRCYRIKCNERCFVVNDTIKDVLDRSRGHQRKLLLFYETIMKLCAPRYGKRVLFPISKIKTDRVTGTAANEVQLF